MSPALQEAIQFIEKCETPWSRDTSPPWGIHELDPAPYNRLYGPVHGRGPVSGVLFHKHVMLAEWGEPHKADLTFSVAKTYLALLAGIAFDQGLLPDVHEPVIQKCPGIGFEGERLNKITWQHLLQQTSEWEGTCLGIPEQVDRYRWLTYQPGKADGIKGDARPLGEPGSRFEYNDVRINQLSLALLHLFKRPLPEVFEEFMGNGNFKGTQILSAKWLAMMQQPCDVAPYYGYLIWLNKDGALFKDAPRSSWFALGAGSSVTWVDPKLELVCIMRWIDAPKTNDCIARIMRALEG